MATPITLQVFRGEQLLRLEHTVTRCLAEADSGAALKTIMRAVCETQGWDCGRYFRADEQAGVLRYARRALRP